MVLVFQGLIGILIDFGLQGALIQRRRDSHTAIRYHTAFWVLCTGGVAWWALYIFLGVPLMSTLFQDDRVLGVALLIAPCILFQSISLVPEIILTRRLKFDAIAKAEITASVGSSFIAVSSAFLGAGIYALIIQHIIYHGVRALAVFRASKWSPRMRFHFQSIREVMSFSCFMLGSRVLYFIRTNQDTILIGAFLGAAPLGVYSMAYTLTENVRTQIARIISRVMLPIYGRMQDEPSRIGVHYLSITRAMTLAFFPISLTLIFFGRVIIEGLFPDEWLAAIVPTKLLALGGVVYAVSGPAAEVFQGIGRVKELFKISLINVVLIGLPLMLALVYLFGINGAAGAMFISFVSMRIMSYYAMRRYVDVSVSQILLAISPSLTATAIAVCINYVLGLNSTPFGIITIWVSFATAAFLVYLDLAIRLISSIPNRESRGKLDRRD